MTVSFINADIYQKQNLILKNVNFNLAEGEFVYLIGKTGSGKSSLLKTIYADLFLEKGLGNVAGYDLATLKRQDIPYLRRKLGIVFQDFQLFMDRTVAENLLFVLNATGWQDKNAMNLRIAEVMQQVGLADKLEKMPHQLSGGEQQRVAIARALLNKPQILIADEPTGNLDPEIATQILRLFIDINRQQKMTVIMATHNYDLIINHPARTLHVEQGGVSELV